MIKLFFNPFPSPLKQPGGVRTPKEPQRTNSGQLHTNGNHPGKVPSSEFFICHPLAPVRPDRLLHPYKPLIVDCSLSMTLSQTEVVPRDSCNQVSFDAGTTTYKGTAGTGAGAGVRLFCRIILGSISSASYYFNPPIIH